MCYPLSPLFYNGALCLCVCSIRDALYQDRFVLYLQPILDIRQNRVIGHEVLLRMINENGETVASSHFLNIAERFGIIHDIDRWVVRGAIHLVEKLQQEDKHTYLDCIGIFILFMRVFRVYGSRRL